MKKKLRILFVLGLLWGVSLQQVGAAGNTVVVNGDAVSHLPEWAVNDVAAGGKLLLSDSPEEFKETGILYSDTIQGHGRLFYHHVNDMILDKRVVVVLENKQSKPVKVTVYRKGFAGPDLDYLLVGKTAQENYFAAQETYVVEIPAKSSRMLDEKAAAIRIKSKELVNGIYDFMTDRPVVVKVMAAGLYGEPLKNHPEAQILPADIYHLRGTFPYADRVKTPARVYDASKDGQQSITLGDGVIDPFITGVDATDGSSVLNYGNYGVFYKIFVPTALAGNNNIGFMLNPRGGVYAGAVALQTDTELQPPVGTPGDRLFLESPDTATELIKIKPNTNLWVHFMPPGASNLPVKLIITPEK